MLQHRRRILLFLTALLFIQAIYYVFNFHLKNNATFSKQFVTNSTLTTATTIPFQFPGASYSLLTSLAQPNEEIYQTLPLCSTVNQTRNESESHRVPIDQDLVSFEALDKKYDTDLYSGGHWFPRTCRSDQRVAIVICYRHRELHLKLFLNHFHRYLQDQNIDYTIIVVNQHGDNQFNRAALFNVGFLEARKLYPFDCFIFHDVDLLPEDRRNLYICGDRPRHMSVAVDKFNYRLLYATLFGGVTAFQTSDFLACNGYPTIYWGWGGEDDDMYLRVVKKLGKSISRYPIEIARYKMIRSMNHTSGRVNPHRHTLLRSNYDYNQDGLSTIRYQLHQVVLYQLFTLINVTLYEESYEEIRRRLNIKTPSTRKTKKTTR